MKPILAFLLFFATAANAADLSMPPSPGAYKFYDGHPVPTIIVNGKPVQAGTTYVPPSARVQAPQISHIPTTPNLQPLGGPLLTIDPRVFLPPK